MNEYTFEPSNTPVPIGMARGETVTHIHQNMRHKIIIKREATKGIEGFQVETNSDDEAEAKQVIDRLCAFARGLAQVYSEKGA